MERFRARYHQIGDVLKGTQQAYEIMSYYQADTPDFVQRVTKFLYFAIGNELSCKHDVQNILLDQRWADVLHQVLMTLNVNKLLIWRNMKCR